MTSQMCSISATFDTPARLIRALLQLWETHSQPEVSVRVIADRAEASASAIDYHFGSLEHLFLAAQSHAVSAAETWMASKLQELSGADDIGAPGAATLVAALIDEWTEDQRALALAWREAQAAARARGPGADVHRRWSEAWCHFWKTLLTDWGFGQWADAMALFFDGEAAQHLVRWRRPLDRAMLEETSRALFTFLSDGDAHPASDIRKSYQMLAEAVYSPAAPTPGHAAQYDDAAAALLMEEGLAALTFRAVAKRAATTLGTISYHYGSKANLAERAFRRLYETSAGAPVADLIGELPTSPEAMLEAIIGSILSDNPPVLHAMDEISLKLSRSSDRDAFSAVARCLRDPIGVAVLGRLLGGEELPSISLAAAFSSVVRGYDHWVYAYAGSDKIGFGRRTIGIFRRSSDPDGCESDS